MPKLEVSGYQQLMRGMRQLPAETRREIRAEFKQIGNQVAAAAKSNAANKRPSSIVPSITTSVTQKSVAGVARRRIAPAAGIFEFGGRHPIFGRWVTGKGNQEARPYLRPAVAVSLPLLVPQMDAAMKRAIKKSGL